MRIDKWLWAARFFKTRSLATDAVEGGKIKLNGERPKPAKGVKVGDQLDVRAGPFTFSIRVLALSDRRGPAVEAVKLYIESAESQAARQALADELAQAASYVTSLLPPKLQGEIVSDYLFVASSQLGGDLFGYHWLDDNQLAMYLLDVCGHGL